MSGLRVKICGLGSPEDAAAAAAAGADYVGVVLVPGRMRTRSVADAAAIFEAAGSALRVGVFANAPPEELLSASGRLRLTAIQLHGAETVADLAELRRRGSPELWKVLPGGLLPARAEALDRYGAVADAIVVDGGDGGRGLPFDWAGFRPLRSRLPDAVRLVVAGGLSVANVAAAIAQLSPDVVDVSSGVEAAPGRKSGELMRAFVAAARGAARE